MVSALFVSMVLGEAAALQTKGLDRQTQPPLVFLNLAGNNAEAANFQKQAGVPADLQGMLAATEPLGEPELDVNIFVRGGAESNQFVSLTEESLNKLRAETLASGLPSVSISPSADGGSSTTEIVVPSPGRLYHKGAALVEGGQASKPIPVHIIEEAASHANLMEKDTITTASDAGTTIVSGAHTITLSTDGPGDNIHVEDAGNVRNVIVTPGAGASLAEVSLDGLQDYAHEQLQLVKKIGEQYHSKTQGEAPYGCMFARVAAQAAYEAVNQVAHGFGSVISKTCGCASVGDAAVCALEKVPQTCVFPYAAYTGVFSVSQTMWENVLQTTQACRFIQGA